MDGDVGREQLLQLGFFCDGVNVIVRTVCDEYQMFVFERIFQKKIPR